VLRLVKRGGRIEEFDPQKIKRALLLAFNAKGKVPNVSPLVVAVMTQLRAEVVDKTVRVEDVQDQVEDVLMESGHYDVARAFISYRMDRARRRAERVEADPMAMPTFIHSDRYAKWWPEIERRETYLESCVRVREMYIGLWPQYRAEITSAFGFVERRQVLPSMRSMQFGGEACLVNNARIYNCSFTLMDRVRAFQEVFWLLLSGCGVGYSVQMQHVERLPVVMAMDGGVRHHQVEDTIEGWADALGCLMGCAYSSGEYPEFAYHLIRDEGVRLKTSGGRAPGHLGLKRALEAVRAILIGSAGRRLRPVEVNDALCLVADYAVLAGGIRRASLIGLFSVGDSEMMFSKSKGVFRPAYGLDPGLNSWRQMVNISAVLLRGTSQKDDFDRLIRTAEANYGDPGFMFVASLDHGTNPCGEIGLNPVGSTGMTGFGFCNLCEVNAAVVEDEDTFLAACSAAALIGTLQAAMTSFPYLGPVTEEICRREALLGIGLTGLQDNRFVLDAPDLMERGALACVTVNASWAERLGINSAARVTTVKPSGTASISLGCVGSGIHAHWAKRYFRRVTCNPGSPVAQYFRSINPHMVDVKPNGDLSLVFCVKAPDGATTVKSQSASDFVSDVMRVYESWIKPGTARPLSSPGLSHNVSCSVTLRPGDKEGVIEQIWANRASVAAMAFTPDCVDVVFPYAPMQAVLTAEDEARWDRLCASYRAVDWSRMVELEDGTTRAQTGACVGGGCDVG
jgi:ribonucleoside-diphosphate reductase alpha chain